MTEVMVIQGREFHAEDIGLIRSLTATHPLWLMQPSQVVSPTPKPLLLFHYIFILTFKCNLISFYNVHRMNAME